MSSGTRLLGYASAPAPSTWRDRLTARRKVCQASTALPPVAVRLKPRAHLGACQRCNAKDVTPKRERAEQLDWSHLVTSSDEPDLSQSELDTFQAALHRLRAELKQALSDSDQSAKPVALDQPIGRVSRIDAIQQQKMSLAARNAMRLRLNLVQTALTRLDEREYGLCGKCEEQIARKRLSIKPESRFCVACQGERERG